MALYNLSELKEMSDNDSVFVRDMLELFVSNNSIYLDKINNAMLLNDWKVVKFNAHKMKPSILLFKIETLEDVILKLNDFAGNENHLDEIPTLVNELNKKLSEVFSIITAELKKER